MGQNELQHHGVKGMRWGVRRKRTAGSVTKVSEARLSKKSKKWEKNANKNMDPYMLKAHNGSVDKVNASLVKLNAKKEYQDLSKPQTHKKYYEEYTKIYVSEMNKVLMNDPKAISPDKKRRVSIIIAEAEGEKLTLKPTVVDNKKTTR